MNYILNSKNRKLKYKLHLILDRLSFNFLNLTLSQKISLVWLIISLVWLFLNWSKIEYDRVIYSNAFSINSGYVWYMLLVIILFTAFIILSNKNKEKLKTKAHIMFHDYTIILFSWIMTLLLSIVIFNSIRWFTTFFKWISTGQWIILEIVWSIFMITWWILAYREKKQEVLSKVYIENSKYESKADLDEYKDILNAKENQNKSNMSLPI